MLVMKNRVAKIAVALVKKLPVPRAVKKLEALLPPPRPSSAPPEERCNKMNATKKMAINKCNTNKMVLIFFPSYI
jgi:hypothetical protein